MNDFLKRDEEITGGLRMALFGILILLLLAGGGLLYGIAVMLAAWLR